METNRLEAIDIVLVETSHPGNIGACARSMKTMGLTRLHLVNPKCNHQSDEAIARASGATDVLSGAQIYTSLASAVSKSAWIVGTSARQREHILPVYSPRELIRQYYSTYSDNQRLSIVLGPERTGLSNSDLNLCHAHVIIPTNPDYASLNLASALQVIAYEARESLGLRLPEAVKAEIVTAETLEKMISHAAEALEGTSLVSAKPIERMVSRLRRVFVRASLSQDEVDLLHGIWRVMIRLKNHQEKGQ